MTNFTDELLAVEAGSALEIERPRWSTRWFICPQKTIPGCTCSNS